MAEDRDEQTRYKTRHRLEWAGQCRFLTCSCYGRLPLFNNDRIKQAFVDSLIRAQGRHWFRICAWVLMPEHFHLLILPDLPEAPVPLVLNAIKSPLSRRVLAHWRAVSAPILPRITDGAGVQHFWQPGGGYDRNIFSDSEFTEKFRYIHNNPVKRGLVAHPTDWPWSSARWYAGDRSGPVECGPPITVKEERRRMHLQIRAALVARERDRRANG